MSRSNWFSSRRSPSSRRTTRGRKPLQLSRRRKSHRLQVEALEDRLVLSANVTTDLPDYAPGATAQIIASEFAVGETVAFQVLHTDGVPNTGGGHEPWQVTDGVMGDFNNDGTMDGDLDGVADGNIHTTWYVNPDDSANSTFELTANGLSSGLTASHMFTDSVTFSGSGTVNSSSSSRTSASFSHTVGAGTDRLLLVTVLTNGDEDVSSVTYGGVALTQAIERDFGSDDGTSVEIWYLKNAAVGTANVDVTWASSVDPSYVRADNLTGVHQTTPIGATASEVGDDDDIAVNITTTTANSLIFGAVAMHSGNADPFSPGSGLTERWDSATGSSGSNDIAVWGGFRTAATVQSYAVAAEANSSDDWTVAVLEILMSPETPSTSWATTLSVNTANDHQTTSAYNPSGSAGAETPPSQSYQADLYENWDPNVQNAAQTDIVTYQTAGDDHFYYFRFNQRGPVNGNESTVFHLEIDSDFDDVGGDTRSDYFVQFNPSNSDVSSSWRNASLISEELFRDGNNNAGGSNLTGPDSGDPDGYSTAVTYGNNDVFGRIVGGAVEIAVRRGAIDQSATSNVRSRGWTKQDGNIDKSKLMFHDHNTASDLSSNRIDNTHGANTTTWLPTTPAPAEQPAINIEKFVNGNDADSATGPILAAGGTATFTYSVTNTGNVALSNVSVVDNNGTPGAPGDDFSPTFTGGDTNSNGLLDLTETWTYSATRTVVAGQYTNVGTASGKSPGNATVTDTDPANYFGSAPALNIEKLINGQDADLATGPILAAGGTATFTYQVTNTGNNAVGGIVVVDDNGTPGSAADDFNPTFTGGDTNSNGLLDLGENWNYSANRTVVAGQYTNIGKVSGSVSATGQSVSDTDPANYFGSAPALNIEKLVNGQDADSATGPVLSAGGTATFTYQVTNTGNITVGSIVVVDDNGTPGNTGDDFNPTFTGGDTNSNNLLDLGETWAYSASGTVLAGQYTNIGKVSGSVSATGQSVSDTDPANYFGSAPALNIEKLINGQDADSATGPILAAGGTATFTYQVTNTGNIAVGSIAVVDDNGTPGNAADDFNPTFTGGDTNSNGRIDLGETWNYSATRTVVAGQYTNIGKVTGSVSATGQSVSDTDPANYFGSAPALNIEKLINGQDADSATGPILAAGGTATFTYQVTNTGNITVGSIVVVDDNGTPGNAGDDFNPTFTGGDTNSNNLLDLGETWAYSATGTVVAGQYTNIGEVTGSVAATGQTASDTDPANYFGAAPGVNIEKLVNGQDADSATGPILSPGSTATFTYHVTNTGNVALSNLAVVDDNGTPGNTGDDINPTFTGGDANSNNLLDLGETWAYSATGTVVAGQYTNIGEVTGSVAATGQSVTDTDPANYFGAAPGVNIEKFVNGDDADAPTGPDLLIGSTANFNYQVTNTGNIAVGNVAVVDDNGTPGNTGDDFNPTFTGGDTNSNNLLDLGETWAYSATGTVVAGQYTNIGEVTGSVAATGQTASDTDPANYFGTANPSLDIEKHVNGNDADSAPGLTVKVGDTVTFTYTVTNTGDIAIDNLAVVDDNGTPGNTSDDFSPTFTGGDSNNNGLLDTSETWTYSTTHTAIAGQYTNVATATGSVTATGQTATDSDPANYFGKVDPIIVIAPDKGNTSKPIVKVINKDTGKIISQFYAYEGKFLGGVQVATGDMTGDGIDEIITGPGQGRVGEVRVFAQDGVELTQFRVQPYGSKYTGGVEVAVGDVDGDGDNDIVTANKNGRPDVRVFYNNYNSSYPWADAIADSPSKQFHTYSSSFKGGADVVVADMGTFYNGYTLDAYTPDGKAEIIVGNGPGMVSTIHVYDMSAAPKIVDTILPLSSKFKGGITLSAARVNGDAIPDLIVAAGNGGGSAVETWSGLTNDAYDVRLAAFSTFGDQATKNAPVHATALDTDGNGVADVLAVVQGTNGKSNQIRYFNTYGSLEGIHYGLTGPWNIASLENADPSLELDTKYDVAAKDDIYTLIGATTTAKKKKK